MVGRGVVLLVVRRLRRRSDAEDAGEDRRAARTRRLRVADQRRQLPGLSADQHPGPGPKFPTAAASLFGGEDVVGFCATSLGETTAGLWHMVLDGSAEGMPRNSTDDFSLSEDGQTLYLTTKGTFNVDSATAAT